MTEGGIGKRNNNKSLSGKKYVGQLLIHRIIKSSFSSTRNYALSIIYHIIYQIYRKEMKPVKLLLLLKYNKRDLLPSLK